MPAYPDFDVDEFRTIHKERGEPIRWWRAVVCPNTNSLTGHGSGCPSCKGSGYIYEEQNITGYKALVRGIDEQNQYLRQGLLTENDAQITTIPDEIPLGNMDLILVPGRRRRVSESLIRSKEDRDRLKWSPAESIIKVYGTNTAAGWSLLNDELEAAYIVWADGFGPSEGHTYSILYYHQAIYQVALDIGGKRRMVEDKELPQRVYARLRNPEGLTS